MTACTCRLEKGEKIFFWKTPFLYNVRSSLRMTWKAVPLFSYPFVYLRMNPNSIGFRNWRQFGSTKIKNKKNRRKRPFRLSNGNAIKKEKKKALWIIQWKRLWLWLFCTLSGGSHGYNSRANKKKIKDKEKKREWIRLQLAYRFKQELVTWPDLTSVTITTAADTLGEGRKFKSVVQPKLTMCCLSHRYPYCSLTWNGMATRKETSLSLSLSMYLVETRVNYGLGMAHAGSPTPAASFAFLPSARERALAADSGFCVSSLFCLSNLYTGRID